MKAKKIKKPQREAKSKEYLILLLNSREANQEDFFDSVKKIKGHIKSQNIQLKFFSDIKIAGEKATELKENNISILSFDELQKNNTQLLDKANKVILLDYQKFQNDSEFITTFNNVNDTNKDLTASFCYLNKQLSAVITNGNVLDYLLSLVEISNNNLLREIGFFIEKLNVPKQKISLYDNKPKSKKNNLSNIIKRSVDWFVKIPLKELQTKPHLKYDFIKEPSIFRLVFLALAIALFIAMPLMSLNTGVSGDEDRHVEQAENVYKYFTSKGEDKSYMNTKYGPFYAYNITFDVALHMLIKWFKIENVYNFRHFINAIFGFLALLFSGLLAAKIKGWRAAVLTILILFISPRFLGHSYNNPKDIPYALGYVMGIYFLVKLLKELPELKLSTGILLTLSIGYVLNTRIGGLLVIAYIYFFTALFILHSVSIKKWFEQENLRYYLRVFVFLTICSFVGFVIGIIFWPYALEDPVKNTLESLKIMTNHSIGIRQVFEGKFIWSDNVPWYYSVKYMLITIPMVVFVGLFLFLAFIKKMFKELNPVITSLLLFSFIFPVYYVIYKESNVYGGWRHLIFVYLFIVISAALGFNVLFKKVKKTTYQYILGAALILLSYHPIRHVIKNHPLQYIYFNEFIGGVDNAFGNYEIDYYYHSIYQASDWLKEKLEKEGRLEKDSVIRVATNFVGGVKHYFRKYDNVHPFYVRYYERGNSDWDYAIIATSYINADEIKVKSWPPQNTIHKIEVDNTPSSIILERKTKDDYRGYQALRKQDYLSAIRYFNDVLKVDKTNEITYLNLATAYMYVRRFDLARNTIYQLLEVYPKYDKGLNILGLTYYNENNYEEAYKIFTSITEMNPKFVSAFHNLGLVFYKMGKKDDALKYFQQAIKTNRKYKPPYLAIASILKESGREEEARKFLDAAEKLK